MADLPVSPIANPQAYDAFIFAGEAYLYCDYSGFDRLHKWDEKDGKGAKGATNTYVSDPLAKGTVTFHAWEEDHFTQFRTIREILRFDPTKKTGVAVEVWHPALVENDITALVVTKQGPWHHDGNGMYTRTLEFTEFRPPKKVSAVSTPGSASTGGGPGGGAPPGTPGTTPDPAIAAAKKEYDDALKAAQAKGPP